MFTGIIQAVGRVATATSKYGDTRLTFDSAELDMNDVTIGDSIACNGVCLTVIEQHAQGFTVEVSAETLRCTVASPLGAPVNLEKAMRLQDRLGGHMVSGHVDGTGAVLRFDTVGACKELAIRAPDELARYIVTKGSVAINGVSLTVNSVTHADFSINLIPHTLAQTGLHILQPGDQVNIEIDMMARYAERIMHYCQELA